MFMWERSVCYTGPWFLDVGESYLVRAENIAQVEEWILLWHHVRVELDVEVCIRVFCSRGLLRQLGRDLATHCVLYVGEGNIKREHCVRSALEQFYIQDTIAKKLDIRNTVSIHRYEIRRPGMRPEYRTLLKKN